MNGMLPDKAKKIRCFLMDNLLVVALLALAGAFSVGNGYFASEANLRNLLLECCFTFVFSLGFILIILCGGIDFSAGYQISLVSSLIGVLVMRRFSPLPLILLSLGTGLLCGVLNGFLITVGCMPAYAATMATSVMFKGVSYIMSKGSSVYNLPTWLTGVMHARFFYVPIAVWIAAACLLLTRLFFSKSYLGLYITSVGLNERTAIRAGIDIRKVKILCYAIGGVFFALAGIMMTSKMELAGSSNGIDYEVRGMLVALLGILPPMGRLENTQPHRLRLWRVLVSTAFVCALENGLRLVLTQSVFRNVIIGGLLAYAFFRYHHNKSAEKAEGMGFYP